MSIVWTVREEKKFDISTAEKFGDICVIFSKDLSPFDLAQQQQLIQSDVFPASSMQDYLLTVGPTCMVATLVTMWVTRFGAANLLVWDNKARVYKRAPLALDSVFLGENRGVYKRPNIL